MRRHNVLLICLLLTLPMLAGCTSNSLTAQGGDNGDGETGETVVNNVYNNYYNNTTTEDHSHYYTIYNNTTSTIQETPEMIALGGRVDAGSISTVTWYLQITINTAAGEMVQIHEAEVTSNISSYMKIESECSGDLWYSTGYLSSGDIVSETWAKYLPGSAEDCTHSINIADGDTDAGPIYWSFVYSVLPVTVA